jgi:hypothetical protein
MPGKFRWLTLSGLHPSSDQEVWTMGNLRNLFHSPRFDKPCVISLVSATGFMAVALALGIADNPPGAVFLFASLFALVLALVHRWRSPRRFLKMVISSLVSFPFMVILHNLLEVLAERGPTWLGGVLTGLSVTFFLLAVLVLPVIFFAGIIGFGLTLFTGRSPKD